MGREQSFLTRLGATAQVQAGRVSQPTTREDPEALMESVRENLRRLLNSRQGMSESSPDYGLPSLVDMAMGRESRVASLAEVIRSAIEKFEPRLRHVRVSVVSDEGTTTPKIPVYRVDAVLVGRQGEHRVWYETEIAGDGQFDVVG